MRASRRPLPATTGGAPAGSLPGRRRGVALAVGCVIALVVAFVAVGGPGLVALMRGPRTPFAASRPPAAPDYDRADAWLARPGDGGPERSAPAGTAPVDERAAGADVFFIHPTTYRANDVWNAPFDASGAAAPYNAPVLIGQASVFNGCCRIYAPRYRQATLAALGKSELAVALAYADVARAFRHYLAHDNHGRPVIIAAHSQGTAHAVRLLQQQILGTPLQRRLVAAYLIGGYVPSDFATLGLPTCEAGRQTGCVLSYNTSQRGRDGARRLIDRPTYWWRGSVRRGDAPPAICVNPLTWDERGAAPKAANRGSLPFPRPPFPTGAGPLHPVPSLTGAACRNGLLEVDVPWGTPSGFVDRLSLIFGNYHLHDYGIFYDALRRNASERVAAYLARAGGSGRARPGDGNPR